VGVEQQLAARRVFREERFLAQPTDELPSGGCWKFPWLAASSGFACVKLETRLDGHLSEVELQDDRARLRVHWRPCRHCRRT